jgi:DNA-binding IclR family transcriptional regulator
MPFASRHRTLAASGEGSPAAGVCGLMSRVRTGENIAELDALVASIEQPIRLGAIAAQAGRPAASVRRQLVSLVHAGRLTYPGYGLFAPAGFRSEAVRRTIPALVRAVVDRPMRVRDVAAQVGEPPAALNAALAPLIEQGRLSQPEPGVVAPAGFYSPPSASEFLVVRNAVQASLTQPRRPAEVSRLLGITPRTARSCLHDLVRKGVAVRVGYGLYGMPDAALPLVPARPQPVRDAILACLSQPRRVMEVAACIGRPGSTTTGHLGAMKRLGLVVQVERGVYARPGQHKTRQLSLSVAA